jgi:lambda family phage portal protein
MTATINGHTANGRYRLNGDTQERIPAGVILDAQGKMLNARTWLDVRATGYSNYGANTTKNSMLGWMFRGGDADTDIGLNVQILRERSRDAFMGIPLAAAAIETFDTNVVGEGLSPAPNVDWKALGLTAKQGAALNAELAEKFGWWAGDPRECDFESRDTFYVKQSTVFQSTLLSGDCPVLFPLTKRKGSLFDLRVRVLEADRVINPHTIEGAMTNIFNGVELSDEGELQAYHISTKHPLSSAFRVFSPQFGNTVRIEPFGAQTGRRNMILVIKPERPEQRRGVPILSVCLELLKQGGRFLDSTVIAAVIQSYFTAFITQEFPDPNIFADLLNEDQKADLMDFNPYNVQLGPGVVNFMRPGHKVEFSSPTQPHANFSEFMTGCAKFVGSSVGMPYEVLLKQFNASYSASRAALLDFWKRVRKYRSLMMVDQFCQPAYEEWCVDAVMLNRIENFKGDVNDIYIRRALTRCSWSGSSAPALDPLKEVQAAAAKVAAGLSTNEREAMELNGSNWRDNVGQQAVERDTFEENDLVYPPTQQKKQPTGAAAQPPAAPPAARTRKAVKSKRQTRSTSATFATSGAILR